MPNLSVQITGTEAELGGFLRSLEYEADVRVISRAVIVGPEDPLTDRPFGAGEIIDLLVSIATGLGTNAAYDIVADRFRRYRAERRHMLISRVELSAPEEADDEVARGQDEVDPGELEN
ncbi:hypothetical protein J5Y04_27985 [Kitasatospora sp. RG8]|uniref:hypothetical protein n=1 Tax=Kitasatospora sp. RG8 TaxID=2820815 RepID=UPI001ADF86EE|nr:hypothetical protein [Kitasatospora sp. RG8]MBP0453356.1 hypothetical protein [Kitasatospora sp. RG8]